MTADIQLKVILIRESVLESWLKDVVTLVCPIVAAVINHRYAGGSAFIYAAIAFFWVTTAIGWAAQVGKRNHYTPEQAAEWLEARYGKAATSRRSKGEAAQ